MSATLWPNLANLSTPRGMREMLRDAAGDISILSNGKLDFYIDTVGLGTAGAVQHVRHNCYVRVAKNNYMHLLFQVMAPVASPFPATAVTPEGEKYPDLNDETGLREAIQQILQRDRTKEVVAFLLNIAA